MCLIGSEGDSIPIAMLYRKNSRSGVTKWNGLNRCSRHTLTSDACALPGTGGTVFVNEPATDELTNTRLGFAEPIDAVILGARSGIGEAFLSELNNYSQVRALYGTSRAPHWQTLEGQHPKIRRHILDIVDEASLAAFAKHLTDERIKPNLILNCTGILHDDALQPERSWGQLDLTEMQKVFAVNTFGVGLVIKHLLPLMRSGERSVFASLSARVGSIEDNRLGGWYSYRASKAAQNMLVKTAAIEAKLKAPDLICVQLHPGTVKSDLSAPFTKRLPSRHRVFTPAFACERLCEVISGLSRRNSGQFFAWDGQQVSW